MQLLNLLEKLSKLRQFGHFPFKDFSSESLYESLAYLGWIMGQVFGVSKPSPSFKSSRTKQLGM